MQKRSQDETHHARRARAPTAMTSAPACCAAASAPGGRLPRPPPAPPIGPRGGGQAPGGGAPRRKPRLRPAWGGGELHPTSSAASAATRSAAPGGPSRSRTSARPSRCRRAASLSESSNGSTASASARGVAAPCRNSGDTSRPAIRFTSPTYGTRSSRIARAKETGFNRYAITMGRSASAAELRFDSEDHREPPHHGQLAHPSAAPRPHLRGDVVEDRVPQLVGGGGRPKVVAGVIDQEREVIAVHPEGRPHPRQEPVVGE